MKDVRGKVALVTGGAYGMGLLWCERFAADGAKIVIWDISEANLERAMKDLERRGVKVWGHIADVSKPDVVREKAAVVQRETGGVDVLVNNAGIVHSGPFLETSDAQLAATIDVDLKGIMWCTKAFLPRMLERNKGHIINIASLAGYVGVPRMPAYSAAKWGAIGLTESIRLEVTKVLRKKGVKFTVVCPSFVDTGMFAGAKPPRLTRLLRPKDVVDVSYEAFKQDKYVVNMPWLTQVTPLLKGLLPYQAVDIVTDLFGASDPMREWRDERR
jgi:NAD(P)-dependent dehydrogenase (short-subunit alcohol dehydrogenase family)